LPTNEFYIGQCIAKNKGCLNVIVKFNTAINKSTTNIINRMRNGDTVEILDKIKHDQGKVRFIISEVK